MLKHKADQLTHGSAVEITMARGQVLVVVGSDEFCGCVRRELLDAVRPGMLPIEAVGKLSESLRSVVVDLDNHHGRVTVARTFAKQQPR